MNQRKFRAVFFDAGETLIKVHPSVGEIYCDAARRFGSNGEPARVESLFRRAFGEKKANPNGEFTRETEKNWWYELVQAVFEKAGVLDGLGTRFDECFEYLYEIFHGPTVWRVYEDVAPTLEGLRAKNIPAAVVSNWDTRLPGLLESLGLTDHLQFILTSAEVGFEKPSPEIFLHAAEKARASVSEILHVGDRPTDDVEGALNAGMQGLLIDRSGNTDFEPKISSLTEVLSLV